MSTSHRIEAIQTSLRQEQAQPAPSPQNVQATPDSSSQKRNHLAIIIALFALYVVWGGTYLAMRIALQGFPPFLLAATRFLTAGSIMYVFLRLRGEPNPTRSQWLGSLAVGGLLLMCCNGGVVFSEQWVASGLAALALGAIPLWAALFSGLFGRWPTRREWLGLALGFVGVALLNIENGLSANLLSAVVLLIAPMCWAFGSIWSQRLPLPKGGMASAAQMLGGGSLLAILGLSTGERMTSFPPAAALWAMAFLVLGGSLIGFTAYVYLLKHVRPALATSYAYVNPVIAVGLGVGLAGEHITVLGLLSMVTILGGVGLMSVGRTQKST
jgi:drug/metabolite transporter (DMT)-like permease